MHELAITQEIVRIVTEQAERLDKAVATVHLQVGALSGVVPESVEFYFEHLGQGTPCQGARLVFERVGALAHCRTCKAAFEPQEFDWSCPHCGNLGADLVSGKELAVAAIEVEDQ